MAEELPRVMVRKVTLRRGLEKFTSTFREPKLLSDAVRLCRVDIKMFNPKEKPHNWHYESHSTT